MFILSTVETETGKIKFSKYFDHTLLKSDATEEQVKKLCQDALQFNFASVCVNSYYVPLSARLLKNSGVKVCTVVGFPLGANLTVVKTFEARKAIQEGAQEIDMVINIGALKDRKEEKVYCDIFEVVKECRLKNVLCKVILETSVLSDEEKRIGCRLAKEAGAHFVKTSTGFASGGATPEDVRIMKSAIRGSKMGIKASGGIRTLSQVMELIEAGATRLGTSGTVKIMQEYQASAG
ncbi:MAG: deoxyribose-phosphate aldolase [bacterium]|nr:MAG: deoxyribose-phosphate aldolase [bacterium]